MHQRKVQNIAGMTYTVSLPKGWIQKHGIKAKSPVMIHEQDDGSLLLSPDIRGKIQGTGKISFSIDKQESNISHILFATYYLGYESIRLYSKKGITGKARNKIKNTIDNLSGVEVVYEDENRVDMKVLLDNSKVNINQILFRINLIISSSIDSIQKKEDISIIRKNEDEIDRLHHLTRKMIFLSSRDSALLKSSGIGNVSHAFSYSMINNKMEIIADNLAEIAEHITDNKPEKKINNILAFFRNRCSRDISLLVKEHVLEQHAKDMTEIGEVAKDIEKIKDSKIKMHLNTIAGLVAEIEEEMMNLFYYKKIVQEDTA